MSLTVASLLVLTFIHLFNYKLHFITTIPRSKLLSISGGVAIAYVFLHVLPQLADYHFQQRQEEGEKILFFIALSGLVCFYGMERMIRTRHPDKEVPVGDFWLHLFSFTVYNLIIGILLVTEAHRSAQELGLFTFAIALHFLNTDFGLWFDYKHRYPRYGRWTLCAGLWLGYLLGRYYDSVTLHVPYLFAFLVGGVILNSMKEELPKERRSNFGAFLTGVGGYGLLLWWI